MLCFPCRRDFGDLSPVAEKSGSAVKVAEGTVRLTGFAPPEWDDVRSGGNL